ncbi:hypothetical protein AUEXF2481DRAFT_606164 [Aureobasidium subglaciale EXF-2481]|uniref:Uncharacterized protein n=1 Tax=Aureobasidium subglaciale (strain EXF-2481) TaxID=1043005 RepID=A0A074YU21_AURSE|nr:uncharacterized protein AUEXF2481DRAFT_606164 [Aureobasidium subglaciale EXF-2481]KEQ97602.1 hypothetical protein AUEXF2481DRAFT_606164 [Aureobasidium subglaciale EXF-2481]
MSSRIVIFIYRRPSLFLLCRVVNKVLVVSFELALPIWCLAAPTRLPLDHRFQFPASSPHMLFRFAHAFETLLRPFSCDPLQSLPILLFLFAYLACTNPAFTTVGLSHQSTKLTVLFAAPRSRLFLIWSPLQNTVHPNSDVTAYVLPRHRLTHS